VIEVSQIGAALFPPIGPGTVVGRFFPCLSDAFPPAKLCGIRACEKWAVVGF